MIPQHKHPIWRGGLEEGLHFIGTTAALIMGGVAAAGSIGGAAIGAHAAGSAAAKQVAAANAAGEQAQAEGQKQSQAIKDAATGSVNRVDYFTADALSRLEGATNQGQDVLARSYGAGERTLSDIQATGQNRITAAQGAAQDTLSGVYKTGAANLSPYQEAGNVAINAIGKGIGEGGDFNRNFTMADYQADPGYAFRLQQGQQALERSAAAHGSLLGGGTLKSLTRYSQGMASQEYGNAYQRFMDQNAARFGRLSGTAGIGLTAAEQANALGQWYGTNAAQTSQWGANAGNQMGQWYGGQSAALGQQYSTTAMNNLMQGASLQASTGMESASLGGQFNLQGQEAASGTAMQGALAKGQYLTGGANAAAAGQVGAANAWSSGITGATGGIMNSYLLSQLMNPGKYNTGADIPLPSSTSGYTFGLGTPGAFTAP